jgi:hypothetical protein
VEELASPELMTSTWGAVVEMLTPAAFSMFGLGDRSKKRSTGCALAMLSLGSISSTGAARVWPGRVANSATLTQTIQIRPKIDDDEIRPVSRAPTLMSSDSLAKSVISPLFFRVLSPTPLTVSYGGIRVTMNV